MYYLFFIFYLLKILLIYCKNEYFHVIFPEYICCGRLSASSCFLREKKLTTFFKRIVASGYAPQCLAYISHFLICNEVSPRRNCLIFSYFSSLNKRCYLPQRNYISSFPLKVQTCRMSRLLFLSREVLLVLEHVYWREKWLKRFFLLPFLLGYFLAFPFLQVFIIFYGAEVP